MLAPLLRGAENKIAPQVDLWIVSAGRSHFGFLDFYF
jgi:hypothetical protein